MRISDWSSDVCSSDLRPWRDHNKPGRSQPGPIAEALAWPRQSRRARGLGGDYVAEDAPTEDLSEETRPAEDAQPDKLRVHSLARVLGTTSKPVLDALATVDDRPSNAQSTVEEDEAQRVRDALASPEERSVGKEWVSTRRSRGAP